MKKLGAIFWLLFTSAFIVALNNPIAKLPALGKLLDPVNGWAANAESVSKDFNKDFTSKDIQQPVKVWIEDRMVPHIQAANNHDLYFTQGYLHAYFRLWQMEFQTYAAAGRIGEIIGEKIITDPVTQKQKNAILEFDRGQRRKGLVYGAENSLKAMEADPRTKEMLDAYTAGVNFYIASLNYKNLPLEYKLIGYRPERWTNLKCALLLKYMADDLTGYTEDFAQSILRDQLPQESFQKLFPQRLKESIPVIPSGTQFSRPSLQAPSIPTGDIWMHFSSKKISFNNKPVDQYATEIGSNNWAISGKYTASGSPILCNDPHLGLNLPSLWFEVQLQSPEVNVYGVSLPGAPGIVIGFNDSISWGLTNNYRDVKDFYEITPVNKNDYQFDDKQLAYQKRTEVIKIKGKKDFIDTVYYTVHGPVMYDETFKDPTNSGKQFALCWMAHRGSNELLSLYLINRAKNYDQFTQALMHFGCPAQNFVYADRTGNIAIWGQGQFINKWKDQGRYVMNGNTSNTLWGENIPMRENPHAENPEQGYLASANQITTDTTYPYWYNGYFYDFRALRINEMLRKNKSATIESMELMQNDTHSILAENILPILIKNTNTANFNKDELKDFEALKNWDYNLSAETKAGIVFQIFWDKICDHFKNEKAVNDVLTKSERVMNLIQMQDENNTQKGFEYWHNMSDELTPLFKSTIDSIHRLRSMEWYKVKNTSLTHLAKIPAFSYDSLKIGGWGNTINAAKSNHGPSWRMIVEMDKDSIRAVGVYPGGQSGNPGSKYYSTFVDHWVQGKYYRLLFLSNQKGQNNKQIKYSWMIHPKNN